MAFFRITLMRSGIGLPQKTRGVLAALGLTKRMKTVFLPVTPDAAGQLMKVKELVDVQEVDQPMSLEQLKASRRPDPGYYVEKKAFTATSGLEIPPL
jgi:large subunit ribosomal protein L30